MINEGALVGALRITTSALRATGCFVVAADEHDPRLVAGTTHADRIGPALAPGLMRALVAGRTLTVPLAATHSRFRDLPVVRKTGGSAFAPEVGALVCTPLHAEDGVVMAGLCLWDSTPRAWSPDDLARLQDAAALIGPILTGGAASIGEQATPEPIGEQTATESIGASHEAESTPDHPHGDTVGELGRGGDWIDTLLATLPDGVAVVRGPEGRAVRANAEFLRLTASDSVATAALPGDLFTHAGAHLDPDAHPLPRALAGEEVHGLLVCTAESPEHEAARWWQVSASPLYDARESVVGAVLVVEDVSEMRSLQESLYRSQEHLVHAHKMESVGRLAGGMAHDFNNLLTAIMGFGELLLEDMDTADPAREDALEIVRSASRGRDLTNQLLAFSRRRSTQPTVLDLNEGVESSRRLVERLLDNRVRLLTHCDDEAGRVRIDRTELEQILVNLALNGRDALPQEGGTVRIETGPVHLTHPDEAAPQPIPAGRWETLGVVDDGAGMDDAVRDRIFEPFFTTKPAGEGTGLGLATVQGIVKRAGGYIRVESRPGAGTTFRLYLPAVDEAVDAAGVDDGAAPMAGSETVLLVEDQDQIRSLLARQLERAGFTVVEASNGHEALATWASEAESIDIVVSDIVMPIVDGPTMVEKARATRPDLPVIFISGFPGAADPSEREIPLPESQLVRKPFAAAELIAAIRTALDDR